MEGKTNLKDDVYQCCIDNLVDPELVSWFAEKIKTLEIAASFYLSFGLVNKKVENQSITISAELLKKIQEINPAFSSDAWTLVAFCRLAFLLQLDPQNNKEKIVTLLTSADMKEQVVIYKSLQYLENAEDFLLTSIDGIRTNMIDVFDAIALENAFPFTYFSEDAWNHMVLKAIFMERPIYRIYGIDQKKNSKLASILHDFVHERWAAGRPVTPELWRMISGFENEAIFEDLKKVIITDTELAKEAAFKVLEESNNPEIKDWLKNENTANRNLSWDDIGKEIRLLSGV